jgi:hypothetical protein
VHGTATATTADAVGLVVALAEGARSLGHLDWCSKRTSMGWCLVGRLGESSTM